MDSQAENSGPLRVGQRFGKYDIVAVLGRGGYAFVYKAFDVLLQRHVALKVLHSERGITAETFGRAVDEARLLTKLEHPNIVKVLDVNVSDSGSLYLVMELLEGRTLQDVLKERKRLTIEEALRIFAEIAEGVDAAHQRNAIHRDLKPANVFVLEGNRVKVLDFGIAKIVGSDIRTQRNVILGTALYMSPQQIRGESVTAQGDIFSLGIMLWEALAGCHPITLKNIPLRSFRHVVELMPTLAPPLLSEIDRKIPLYVARMVNRALAPSLEQRYATVPDLIRDLRGNTDRYLRDIWQSGGRSYCTDVSKPLAQLSVEAVLARDTEPVSQVPYTHGDPTAPPPEAPSPQSRTAPLERAPHQPVPAGHAFAPMGEQLGEQAAGFAPTPIMTAIPLDPRIGPRGTVRLQQHGGTVEPETRAEPYAAHFDHRAPAPATRLEPRTPPSVHAPVPQPQPMPARAPLMESGARRVAPRGVVPSTVDPVEAPSRSGQRASSSSGRRTRTTGRRAAIRTMVFGSLSGLLLAGLGFATYTLLQHKAPDPGAATSPVVIESVEQAKPPGTPSVSAAQPTPPAISATTPSAAPAPAPQPVSIPRAAQAPAQAKAAPPGTVAATPPPKQAAAPVAATSSTPAKDKWDDRLEMFDEAAKQTGTEGSKKP